MEDKLTCIAVDDNALFLNQMEAYIDEIEWLELLATYSEPVKGATGIISHKPDIIFLDIEMPHLDGYSMIEWLLPNLNMMEKKPYIVVISARQEVPHEINEEFLCYINKSTLTSADFLQLIVRDALTKLESPD